MKNITIVINTPDANSFRESEGQIATRMALSMRHARERMTTASPNAEKKTALWARIAAAFRRAHRGLTHGV